MIEAAAAVGARGELERFTHGTTVATNALLERKGARTAFVATAGFEHLLHLRRQTRAHLYRLCDHHPEPLVPLERCFGVRERIGPEGVLEPLDLDSLPELDAEAVAVCLLFSFRDPTHERPSPRSCAGGSRRARRRLARGRARVPRVRASLDDRRRRLPGAGRRRYLGALAARCREAGLPEPLVMRSSGGVVTLEEAAAHPALVLVSGPAAGVVGAARIARLAGFENAITFDMGGTSTDVCLIAGGEPGAPPSARSAGSRSGCRPSTSTPSAPAAARSPGATRAARSGSARRAPAPIPGRPATAAAGRADRHRREPRARAPPGTLAGGLELDRAAAERALGDFDREAVVEVVNAEMLRALRVVSVERGHDPRDFALVAFGGAGPLHACALAEELGIRTVLVPAAAGVLSALGLVASDERRDPVRSYVVPLEEAGELPERARPTCATRGSRSS